MNELKATPTLEFQLDKLKKTYRAAVLAAPGVVRLEEVVFRPLGADEVKVTLEGCGLCASNLPLWQGREWFEYPMPPGTPGHEGWGVVVEVGEKVENLRPGDRVALLSNHAFAEFDYAPAAEAVRLPPSLDGQPFPGEPLGCALNIYHRSDIRAGQTVAIVGTGFLGACLVQLAKSAGARVIALSNRQSSRELAARLGADEVVAMDDHYRIIGQVKELTGGEFCDRVIECTGKEWPLNLAAELTRVRGKLIIAGYHQDGMRQVNIQLWNWRGLDVINAHERDPEMYRQGIRLAIRAVEDGVLDTAKLFSHVFPLSQLADAFRLHHDSPEGFVKALIVNDTNG